MPAGATLVRVLDPERCTIRISALLPSGTVTFLFTDIEGSTQLWERHPEAMQAALVRHDALLRAAVEAHHGTVIKTTGDGLHAVFASAAEAAGAVLAGQRPAGRALAGCRPAACAHGAIDRRS
jgi:class 3 adenylate cyclase